LFGSQVGDYLRQLIRGVSPQKREGLRFVLDASDVPEVARLPWEFAYDQAERNFVFTAIHTPMARWLRLDQPIPTLRVAPPLKLLITAASPKDLPELAVGEELFFLHEELAELAKAGGVTVTRLEHATLDTLNSALDHHRPHVLHFIGHGDSEGESGFLFLEDDRFTGAQLADLLKNHSHHLRLVFLNSCLGATGSTSNPFGGVAQWMVRRGIPAVVAMQFPITDEGAVVLAREFYSRLGGGAAVDAALAAARNLLSIKRSQTAEWGAPVLYMQPPDGRLFDLVGTRESIVPPPPPTAAADTPQAPTPPGAVLPVEPAPEDTPARHGAPARRRWRRLAAALLAVGLTVVGLLVLLWSLPWLLGWEKVPQPAVDAAQTAINEAREAEAEAYAPDAMSKAEGAMKAAEAEIARQDDGLSKRYDKARELLAQAKADAEAAVAAAVAGKAKAREDASAALSAAQTDLAAAEEALAGAPDTKDRQADVAAMQADIETLEGVLAEAQSAFDAEDYKGASAKAQQVSDESASIQADVAAAARRRQQ
jgi:hypothetical protein